MEKAKLLKLAKFLREYVKPKWFNLETWAEEGFLEKKCGTTACALGWSTVCFPRSNLKLVEHGDSEYLEVRYTNKDRSFTNFEAAEKFYGITNEQALYLFDPDSYPESKITSKSYVAKRIEKFVEKEGAVPEYYL